MTDAALKESAVRRRISLPAVPLSVALAIGWIVAMLVIAATPTTIPSIVRQLRTGAAAREEADRRKYSLILMTRPPCALEGPVDAHCPR